MTISFGLAMMATAILLVRLAMIYAVSPAMPVWFRDFLNGSVATLLILVVLVTGLMLFANTLFLGIWKDTTFLDVVVWVVISGSAALAWIGLGRLRHPTTRQEPAGVVSMSTPRQTPPANGVVGIGRRPRKRAA